MTADMLREERTMAPETAPRTPSGTAAHRFLDIAARCGTSPALRQGEVTYTYEELARSAGGVARWLREQGVGRGDVVATLMDRSPRCMAAVLGAWAVGAAYVHLEATDPDPRVATLLATTGATAVVTDERNAPRARDPHGRPSRTVPDAQQGAPYEIGPDLDPADVAYLVCTSGSTGTPKAVVVQHSALLNYCDAFWERITPDALDSFGLATTFAADLGKVSVYGALLSGARLDVYPRDTTLDPAALAADLKAHPADCLTYTPSQLEALGAEGDLAALLPERVLVVAGEAFPPRLAEAVLRVRPDLEVHNGYGPSEATILATTHRVDLADGGRTRVPVGTPLGGVRARVLGVDGRPVPDGTPGILYLGGACAAAGYLGEPELTAAKFAALDGPEGESSTAPTTSSSGSPAASSTTWGAPTGSSRSGATASSPARWRARCSRCPASGRPSSRGNGPHPRPRWSSSPISWARRTRGNWPGNCAPPCPPRSSPAGSTWCPPSP